MNVELILTSYLNDSDVYHDNLLLSAINITCVPYVRCNDYNTGTWKMEQREAKTLTNKSRKLYFVTVYMYTYLQQNPNFYKRLSSI